MLENVVVTVGSIRFQEACIYSSTPVMQNAEGGTLRYIPAVYLRL